MATESKPMKDATAAAHPARPSRGIPWQIWIAVLFLGLEGIGNLLSIPTRPAAASWLAAKCLFIAGLIRGWRWVFVLFLAVAGFHILAFSAQAPFVACLNLVLVLLVGSALRHFFPEDNPGARSAGPKRMPPAYVIEQEWDGRR